MNITLVTCPQNWCISLVFSMKSTYHPVYKSCIFLYFDLPMASWCTQLSKVC